MTQELTTTNSAMSLISQAEKFNSIAKTFADSGLFTDVRTQAQCFVKIMAGAEMGIPPFTAMNSFHIIKGKTTMTANAIAARVKGSKRYDYRVMEKSAQKCVIEFYEHGQKVHTETWDVDRARKAGTQNMDKYPDAMLFARALTAGARAVCPDVVGQYYTPEEMGAPVDAEGNYIDSTATVVDKPAKRTVEIVDDGNHDGGVVNEPVAVVVPPQNKQPANVQAIRDYIAKEGNGLTVKQWHKLNAKAADVCIAAGANGDAIDAHVVPTDVLSVVEIRNHTEALLTLAEQGIGKVIDSMTEQLQPA